jgi:hypothetical protein
MIERVSQVMANDGEELFPGGEIRLGFSVALLLPGYQVGGRLGGGLMMGPSHFGRGIRAESFGVNGFVRCFSFDAQSFVSLCLAVGAAPADICPPEFARSIRFAATLPFGFVGHNTFRIPIDVRLALALPLKFVL